jgi:hypothetical protein
MLPPAHEGGAIVELARLIGDHCQLRFNPRDRRYHSLFLCFSVILSSRARCAGFCRFTLVVLPATDRRSHGGGALSCRGNPDTVRAILDTVCVVSLLPDSTPRSYNECITEGVIDHNRFDDLAEPWREEMRDSDGSGTHRFYAR